MGGQGLWCFEIGPVGCTWSLRVALIVCLTGCCQMQHTLLMFYAVDQTSCDSHLNLMPEQTIMLHLQSFSTAGSQTPSCMSCVMATSKIKIMMNVNITVYVSTVSCIWRCSFKGFLSKDKLKLLLLCFENQCRNNNCLPVDTNLYATWSICYSSCGLARRLVNWSIAENTKLVLASIECTEKPSHCVQ